MKIIVFSAHPDDAETGAGGFCARMSKLGHNVIILHMGKEKRGRKIKGIPEAEVRIAEAEKSAKILGVKVKFFDYYHSEYSATEESTSRVEDLIKTEKPDIVLTQWPIDTHPDHQVVGILPLRSYFHYKKSFCFGFYEVYTGIQTIDFCPNRYVDISDFIEQKRKAILAHRSQQPEKQVEMHEKMSIFRGLEIGCKHAEAFHILDGKAETTFDKLFNI